jgi:hypothetical protein
MPASFQSKLAATTCVPPIDRGCVRTNSMLSLEVAFGCARITSIWSPLASA